MWLIQTLFWRLIKHKPEWSDYFPIEFNKVKIRSRVCEKCGLLNRQDHVESLSNALLKINGRKKD